MPHGGFGRISRLLAAAALVLAGRGHAQGSGDEPGLLRARLDQLTHVAQPAVQGVPLLTLPLLRDLYAQRDFRLVWDDSARVAALLDAARASAEDGLTPGDYLARPLQQLAAGATMPGAADTLRADLDLLATESLIRLASSMLLGKVDPATLDTLWKMPPPALSGRPREVIEALLASDDLPAAVAALAPRHPLYQRLRSELARYRALEAAGAWTSIPPGRPLRSGATDARVPALRHRLAELGDLPPTGATPRGRRLDPSLDSALVRFQARLGLVTDGILGPRTLGELNVAPAARIKTLRVNLERARWILRGLGPTFIAVNIPAYQAYYLRDDSLAWSGRAVVGQPYLQTPEFRARMTYLVINPTWTVPPQILTDEVLPAIRRDSTYLASQDMLVVGPHDSVINPADIDWDEYDGRTLPYRIVQQPGPLNPLGQIKFIFPNPYAVYLHDTPQRRLFLRSRRTFSHGCIRIQSPMDLAGILLGDTTWTPAALDSVAALGTEETIPLPNPVEVMITYWTAWTARDGALNFRPDVYGRDGPLLEALDAPMTSVRLAAPAPSRTSP